MRTRSITLHVLLGFFLAVLAASPVSAFHFPWDQGHDTFQPNPPDDSQEPECPDEDNRCETSNPVDIGAGDKIQRSVDFSFPGFGPRLSLIRSYHSQDLSDGPFGLGWHSNLTVRLILVTDGESNTAIVVQGDGKRKRFTQQADGSWAAAPGTYKQLSVAADGSATLRDKQGSTQFFDRTGRLTRIQDRNGNALIVAYDASGVIASATAASGRTLAFTKGADGRIARVTDALGRAFDYLYDANGYLTRVTDPEGGVTQYSYYAGGNLHTVVDARGNTAITLTYDDKDRVIREVLADGATYQFAYLSDTQTRVTNPRGFQTLYTFNATGQPIEIRDPLGRTTRSAWDANYNRISHTDGRGNRTEFTYDANGNLLTETDALDQVTAYTYEATYSQVTSEADAEGNITRFEYDARGNLTAIIDAQGSRATMTYDDRGRLIAATDPRGNTASYGFDAAGNLASVTDALGNRVTMTYDAVGNLTSVTDAAGRVTTFAYDGLNRRTGITDAAGGQRTFAYDPNGNITGTADPRGNATSYVYDSRNRLSGRTNALLQTESRLYDANGNLASVTDVAGNTRSYGYDAGDQRTTETLPGSAAYRYEYDNAGNRTAIIDPTGVRTEQVFDAIDRPVGLIAAANGDLEAYAYDGLGNRTYTERRDATNQVFYSETLAYDALSRVIQIAAGMGQTTDFGYDANGNLTAVTDPLGRTTTRSYDAMDRVSRFTDAAGGITQLTYDLVGNLIGVSDPRGLVTAYSYDALDRQEQLNSPDTGVTGAQYDANGNLISQVDSRSITVTHAYDQLDRRVSTGFPILGEDRTYLYDQGVDGIGRLAGYDDPSGQTRFTYDARGNLMAEDRNIGGQAYHLAYVYDAADRMTSLAYPSGLTVTYGYDGQGRVRQITADGQPVLSDIAYLPFGPASTWIDGSGLMHTEGFDADYRPTGITVGGIQDFSYLFDAADNITDWSDALDAARSQTFGYDALDRVIDAEGPYGIMDLNYDAVGNRITKTVGTNVTSYTYAVDSHRLQQTTGADPGTYSYDAAGNLLQDHRFTYVYSQANRLAEVRQGGLTVATYSYNSEGQRVVKTTGGQTRHFVYGPKGQLIGVYDGATGSAVEEIVYFGTVPVATVRAGVIYYIHTDHLGTPRSVSSQTQTVVWRWTSDPFGEATPNRDPDGDGVPFVFDLRFPGQYSDAETGRNYNYFRDYDPAIGRYVQSDPIGLAGGLNTYLYAYGNPLRYMDSYGLGETGAIVGGAIGGVVGTVVGGVVGGGGGAAGGTLVAPGVGTVGGGTAGAIEGAAVGGTIGTLGGAIVGSAIEDAINAITDALSGDDADEADQDLTDTDNPRGNDPCKGLRRQLRAHEDKLRKYRNDPDAYDNKGLLQNCPPERRDQIIEGRIRNLQKQIENFRKQLQACERRNGL